MQYQYLNSPISDYDVPIFFPDDNSSTITTLNSYSFDNNATAALFPDLGQDASSPSQLYQEFSISGVGGGSDNSIIDHLAQQLETYDYNISTTGDNFFTSMMNEEEFSAILSSYYNENTFDIRIPQHSQQQELIIMEQSPFQQQDELFVNSVTFLASPVSLQSFVNTPPSSSLLLMQDHSSGSNSATTNTPSSNFSSPGSTTSNSSIGTNPRQRQQRQQRQQQHQQGRVPCPNCHMRFGRLQEAKRHLKIHTGERDHHCDSCPASFARKDALVRHQKTLALRGDPRHGGNRSRRERVNMNSFSPM